MITVTIFKDSAGFACGFELNGHAGYGESGQDIVCAAVSALALNTVNSVEAFTEDAFSGEMDEESGRLSMRFTSPVSRESKLLMDSLILGLEDTAESYGEEYINIRFEEV